MNEPCTVESGLFKKKPCGQAAVAKCATCERPLCEQHAVAQLSAAQKRTGAFMCKECDTAKKEYDRTEAKQAEKKKQAEMMKSLANPAAPKKPGAPAPAATAAPAPAGAKAAPPPPPKPADDAPLEFTPSDKTKK